MFYEYMWQKFFITGNVEDYLVLREFSKEENSASKIASSSNDDEGIYI